MNSKIYNYANTFELKGNHLRIHYSSTSFSGKPILTYEDAAGTKQFMGDEIRQLDTEIGQLVTVSIDQVHGTTLHGMTLTLLIPTFPKSEGTFTTWAIYTTRRSGLEEPELPGEALQTYRVEELTGTATHVIS